MLLSRHVRIIIFTRIKPSAKSRNRRKTQNVLGAWSVIAGNVDESIIQSKLVLIELNVQFSLHALFTTDEE